jgi:hypothetical protein
MVEDNEHVQRLIAREREVAHRRDIAEPWRRNTIAVIRKTCVRLSLKSRTRLKPSSVPSDTKDILRVKSPNHFRLLASEVDSTAVQMFSIRTRSQRFSDQRTARETIKSVLSTLAWLPTEGWGHPRTPALPFTTKHASNRSRDLGGGKRRTAS